MVGDNAEFLLGVNKVLSEETLLMIHHLVIVSRDFKPESSGRFDPFWNAIFECSNLRTLVVQREYFSEHGHKILRIPYRLPHLESFELGALLEREYSSYSARVAGCNQYEPPTIVFKASWPVPMQTLLEIDDETELERVMKEMCRGFRYNFCVHVSTAITEQLRLPPSTFEDEAWGHRINNYPVSRVVALAGKSRAKLKLRDGTCCEIDILGLPVSRQLRNRHERQRRLNDSMKASGKGELVEKRVYDEFIASIAEECDRKKEEEKKKKKKKTQEDENEKEDDHDSDTPTRRRRRSAPEPERMSLEEREQRNAERTEAYRQQRIEEKANKRAALTEEMREFAELKKVQRKRVAR